MANVFIFLTVLKLARLSGQYRSGFWPGPDGKSSVAVSHSDNAAIYFTPSLSRATLQLEVHTKHRQYLISLKFLWFSAHVWLT